MEPNSNRKTIDPHPGPSTGPASTEDADSPVVDICTNILVDSVTDVPNNRTVPELFVSGDDSTKLTLAYENLFEIPQTIVQRFADHVTYFDISHNKITNLDTLVYFKKLTSLVADDNPITENCFVPPLPQLKLLWLNHCKISSLYPWVSNLHESCPNLQYLCLMSNPAAPMSNEDNYYEYLQYRLFVISQFPSLKYLDDRKITEDERIEAQRLFKRPFFERIIRPRSTGLSRLVHTSVSWSNISTLGGLWGGKSQVQDPDSARAERNLLI